MYFPHINNFFDENDKKIISYEKEPILTLEVDKIQPSQFYIDEDKVNTLNASASKDGFNEWRGMVLGMSYQFILRSKKLNNKSLRL